MNAFFFPMAMSQSTRAWMAEQDLRGFEEAGVGAAPRSSATTPHDDDLSLGDGYNYSQHLREMGGGTFIPVAGAHALGAASAAPSPLTRASQLGAIQLRESGDAYEGEAFASGGEASGGGADDAAEPAAEAMDDDLLAALYEGEGEGEGFEELNDDFVLQASRGTELLFQPARKRKGRPADEEAKTDGAQDEDSDDLSAAAVQAPATDSLDESDLADKESGVEVCARESARLLDRQFARLMNEYGDDEIGELEQEDPAVRGRADLEAYEQLMDEYLDAAGREARVKALRDFRAGWEPWRSRRDASEATPLGAEGRPEADAPQSRAEQSTSAREAAAANRSTAAGSPAFGVGSGGASEAAALEMAMAEGGEAGVASDADDGIEDHPFFAGLKEAPKGDDWDAETILTTYSTSENHPTVIRVAPKRAKEQIQLHPRSGLPLGVPLPYAKPPLPQPVGGCEEGEDESEDEEGIAHRGTARARGESADEKKQRKAAARGDKAMRRAQKKQTKNAFVAERNKQLDTLARTQQIPSTNLTRGE
mmetsp:Transcript_45304/g.105797  ORF Transcript_45304/g.105797 Transcript_45304/m.105797 type:complete len:537 (-) Transcript_45304:622-2232(-)